MVVTRKFIIFIFLFMIFLYLLYRTICNIKKREIKNYLFGLLVLGSSLITLAAFLDAISEISKFKYYTAIVVCYTLGDIIFPIGLLFWDIYIRNIVSTLNKMAYTDSMTGSYNIRGLEETFDRVVALKESFYVMSFDLDCTKTINDTFGHRRGDEYIINSVKIIQEEIGIRGYVARTGGDEFVALIGHLDMEEMKKIIVLIKERISKIFASEKTAVSVGYSMYGRDGNTLEELEKAADIMMYKDKRNGKKL